MRSPQECHLPVVTAVKVPEGASAAFPERKPPQVAEYSIRKSYRGVLDMIETAFHREHPLFSLAIYYPLAHYIGPDEVNPVEVNRQRQVVGLIRVMFLKRFESSVYAFEKSLERLRRKLLAFAEVHCQRGPERDRLDGWLHKHAGAVGYRPEVQLSLDDVGGDEADLDEDYVPSEMLEAVEPLPRDAYDVAAILERTFEDLDGIAEFLDAARGLASQQDDKVRKLGRLLASREMAERKVLVFTEFADTAQWVESHLRAAGVDGLARIDSGSKLDRAEVIRRFSPYYNGSSSAGLARDGLDEIRVLVSTDVLSEGLNPPGRHPADQLRPALEPGAADAAHRPRGPPHEPRDRGAPPGRSPRGGCGPGHGAVLELPAPRGTGTDPEVVRAGDRQDVADLEHSRH